MITLDIGILYPQDNISLKPSYQLELLNRNVRKRVNESIFPNVIEYLTKLEHISEMFDILVLRSPNYISVYNKEGIPITLNSAFLNLVGCEEDDILQMIRRKISLTKKWYKNQNLKKVERYLEMINRGEIDGYKNISFTLTDAYEDEHPIFWSNFRLPSGTNIRMGTEVIPEYARFFPEELIPIGTLQSQTH